MLGRSVHSSRVAQYDNIGIVDSAVINDQVGIRRVELRSTLKVICCPIILLQRFERKCPPKVCAGIAGIVVDHLTKVCNRIFIPTNKLLRLRKLVSECGDLIDGTSLFSVPHLADIVGSELKLIGAIYRSDCAGQCSRKARNGAAVVTTTCVGKSQMVVQFGCFLGLWKVD